MGRLLSVMFNGDHMADHALFLMLLNRQWATPETFITFFEAEMELLDFMLDHYCCNQLKSDITSIVQEKKRLQQNNL